MAGKGGWKQEERSWSREKWKFKSWQRQSMCSKRLEVNTQLTLAKKIFLYQIITLTSVVSENCLMLCLCKTHWNSTYTRSEKLWIASCEKPLKLKAVSNSKSREIIETKPTLTVIFFTTYTAYNRRSIWAIK